MAEQLSDISILRFFTPFQDMTDDQLSEVAAMGKVIKYASNAAVMDIGSSDETHYFLLDGEVILEATDGALNEIGANTEKAKCPLARLRPSHYKVTTTRPCKMMLINRDDLEKLVNQQSSAYTINETPMEEESIDDQIYYEIILELQHGNFNLPSLPNIATHVRKTIEDHHSGAKEIAKVITADPAIASKIIKTANSALYQRAKPAKDCQTAVITLGTNRTVQLVISYTIKELFRTKEIKLAKRMQNLWEHSQEIAAISHVLASHTPGSDAEEALLAGLVHDIGVIAIIAKACEFPELLHDDRVLDLVIEKMHREVSTTILKSWRFPEEIVEASHNAENWGRSHAGVADYGDFINLAHLHSYIGTPKQKHVPRVDQIPAFKKIARGELTPELSLRVLEESREQISEVKMLLNL